VRKRLKTWISISGRKVRLGEKSIIMGIVNVTPDSFSDGGRYFHPANAVRHGLSLAQAGADWIDIGGESTRPGALPITAAEEIRRVIPVIRGIRARLPNLPISIDTTKAEVAEQAVRAGANILNDISGLRFDPGIAGVARTHHVPLILMHSRGRPATMQRKPFVKSIWRSLNQGLGVSVRRALSLGVHRSQLILDPGLGFGKSRRQNFEILANLHQLQGFGLPILAGASRKSFIQAVASGAGMAPGPATRGQIWPLTGPAQRKGAGGPDSLSTRKTLKIDDLGLMDFADAAMAAVSILSGAHIIRVHNVKAVLPAVRLADTLLATLT